MHTCICCNVNKECSAYFFSRAYVGELELVYSEKSKYCGRISPYLGSKEISILFPWLKKEDVKNNQNPLEYNICEDCIDKGVLEGKIYFLNENNERYPCKVGCCSRIIQDAEEANKIMRFHKSTNFPYHSTWYSDIKDDFFYWNLVSFPFVSENDTNEVVICGKCLSLYKSHISSENEFDSMERDLAWSGIYGYLRDDDFYKHSTPIYYLEMYPDIFFSLTEQNRIKVMKTHLEKTQYLNHALLIFFAHKNLKELRKKFFIPKDIYNTILKKL